MKLQWLKTLLISIFLNITISLHFHLHNTINILDRFKVYGLRNYNISKVIAKTNYQFIIQSIDQTVIRIDFYRGQNLQIKGQYYTYPLFYSQIIIKQNYIYINRKICIGRQNLYQDRGYNYYYAPMNGQMLLAKTSNYAIFSQQTDKKIPIYVKIQINNKEYIQNYVDTYLYDWQVSAPTIFKDLKNGQIIFAQGYHILILNYNYDLLQVIHRQNGIREDSYISEITSFYDQSINLTVIIFRYETNNTPLYLVWQKQSNASQYTFRSSFNTGNKKFVNMYGINLFRAISLQLVNESFVIYYWNTFQSIIERSYNDEDIIYSRYLLASSQDQSIFIVFGFNNMYQVYQIEKYYNIKYLYQVLGHDNHYSPKKRKITNNNRYLFVSFRNYQTNQTFINKVDLSLKITTPITDGNINNNQIDFIAFSQESDLLVTLVCRNSNLYYIIIRRQSDLNIINQFQLPIINSSSVFDIKLAGSDDWDFHYIVAVQRYGTSVIQQNAQVSLYNIYSGNISLSSGFGSFGSLIPISKYIFSISEDDKSMNFLNFRNLKIQLSYKVPNYISYFQIKDDNLFLSLQTNLILIIQIDENKSQILQKGIIYLKQWSGYLDIILPKQNNILLIAQNLKSPTKIVSNFTLGSLIKSEQIFGDNKIKDNATYFLWTMDNGTQCNSIVYIQYSSIDQKGLKYNPEIVRYYQCGMPLQKYPILIFEGIYLSKIFISRDEKYVIIGIKFSHDYFFIVEIRQINNLSKIIYSENLVTQYYNHIEQIFNIDMFSPKQIIAHTIGVINLKMQQQKFSTTYGMAQISDFDVSDNNKTIILGPSISNQNISIIIVFDNFSEILFQTQIYFLVGKIVISPQGTLFGVISKRGQLYIYEVKSKINIYYNSQKIIKFRFMNESKILIQYITTYQILDLRDSMIQTKNKSLYFLDSSNDLQYNDNQDLLAAIRDNTVTIYGSNGEQYGKFIVPLLNINDKIVSIDFSPNNSLMIATKLGNLYILEPNPCPQQSYSQNLQCVECNFPCKSCISSSQCIQYSAAFYILTSQICLIILIIIINCIRKRKNKLHHRQQQTIESQILNSYQKQKQNQI